MPKFLELLEHVYFSKTSKLGLTNLAKILLSGNHSHNVHKIICKRAHSSIFIAYKYGLYAHEGASRLVHVNGIRRFC